ncbi:DUF1836 domain-containing protein [Bacillus mesophilum]|uniref:DUF1836 domain-containing protein n=1 Tax=Bacillus mesophilum TaxID=1071718 RepID=A0A7V7RID3_9BACI|nr:DUF1836 domain-containing protein [Bacillus mesophilum]KAB2329884.1 DUF1836 domain-containing protein [Bacillus mesophilum]
MKEMNEILKKMVLDKYISLEEIPQIDLYMDQVIQLFENKYAEAKRNEDEKVLTKTMINNYAKGKLFFSVKNKKYSKEHIILISLIYQLKGGLSINDIKTTLDGLNKREKDSDFELEAFYNSYLKLFNQNINDFQSHAELKQREARDQIAHSFHESEEELEQILLITSIVQMSNLYRRLAERLVDELSSEQQK